MSSTSERRGRGLGVSELTLRYPRAARPVLRRAELSVEPGTVTGLTGASGSGKTSLLHAVSGLIPWLTPAEVEGEITIDGEPVVDLDPGQRAHLVATCLDRPEAQLFLATVGQEIDAARRLYGTTFAARAVDALGLGRLLDRRVTELSSGERQRVALAVALAGCPRPVLLDEPSTHLDRGGEEALNELVTDAGRSGAPVLLTEQAGWRLARSVDRWLEVGDGVVRAAGPPRPPAVPGPGHAPGSDVVCCCRGLEVSRGGRTLISGIDLELREGEVVLVSGPNGCGKSTLALVLAGLRPPARGTVTRPRRTGLVLPDAELQLFASTVSGEVSAAGTSPAERARVLRRHRLDHLAARAPWTLSQGERQRLVHAALDLLRPEVMVVDEPGQGLGADDLLSFLELVRRRSAKGRAYVVISHRPELAAVAHRRFEVRRGGLEEVTA